MKSNSFSFFLLIISLFTTIGTSIIAFTSFKVEYIVLFVVSAILFTVSVVMTIISVVHNKKTESVNRSDTSD